MHGLDDISLSFSASSLWVLKFVLASLMFGVALELAPRDFARVAQAPKSVLVGLLCQFILLPAATFLLVQIVRPPASVALGMFLVASCPGGNISNLIVYLAGGNTALSVGMTAVSGAAATFLTPLNFAFWAGLDSEASALLTKVAIEPTGILFSVAFLLGLPMVLGMWVGTRFPSVRVHARKPLRIICGLVFFGLVTSTVATNAEHLTVALLPAFALVIAHNGLALGTAYAVGRGFSLPAADLRAVCVEVGIQNSGLALGIIFTVFGGLGGMAMIALLWGIWHIVAGSLLALFWSRRPLSPVQS
tara:strand:- start:369089 stop:370000 length:912 start_codon:yes stop_codon:yes gene_type:complete